MNHELTFLRQMNANRDTVMYPSALNRPMVSNVVYLHSWGTGVQELVFTSHASAARFLEGLSAP